VTSPTSVEPSSSQTENHPSEWELDCGYDDGPHIFPGDWVFGGANDSDPRADPRWRPNTYEYYDARLNIIHTTQTPLCDEQAIDEFTLVAGYGAGFVPVHLSVRRSDGTLHMLKVRYDKATDTATDI
jgi:hypothetical protein